MFFISLSQALNERIGLKENNGKPSIDGHGGLAVFELRDFFQYFTQK
jgi:hypothetical protein